MYDCVIVGGGVIGLSIADQMSLCGRRVAVVDHQTTRRQTSWAAAGILPPGNETQAHDDYGRLCGLSWRLHSELSSRFAAAGHDLEYRKCGGLHLARTLGEAASLTAVARQWSEDGVAVERLTSRTLHNRFPALSSTVAESEIRFAYWAPDEAVVRTPRYLQALRAACETQGVVFLSNRRVVRFETKNSNVTAIETEDGNATKSVEGERFCVAAGAWTESLLRLVDWSIETQPWRGQVLQLALKQPEFDYIVNEGPNYLVPRDDGLVVVGSSVEEVGFDDRNTDEVIQGLVEYASQLMPQLADARQVRHWAGLRPGSPDGFPYLGALPHLSNLYVASGHYRSGIYLSAATGRVMSQLMCDEEPDVNLQAFRLDR